MWKRMKQGAEMIRKNLTNGDQPRGKGGVVEFMDPVTTIASMMLHLTYDQMCAFADGLEGQLKAEPGKAMSDVLNDWAKKQRNLLQPDPTTVGETKAPAPVKPVTKLTGDTPAAA